MSEHIQIQKQHRRHETEVQYDPLPDPVDETELLGEAEEMLGKIAVSLEVDAVEGGSE